MVSCAAAARQVSAEGIDVEACVVRAPDESEHRRLEAVAGEHGPAVRKRDEERLDDAAKRVVVELMERQPLAEDAVRREPRMHGLEVLDRVERAGAAARRVKVVRDDHVVATVARPHVATGVRRDQVQVADSARRDRSTLREVTWTLKSLRGAARQRRLRGRDLPRRMTR